MPPGPCPACVRWCRLWCELRLKPFPQCAQAYGRSPVCTRRCWVSVDLSVKLLPQSAQP